MSEPAPTPAPATTITTTPARPRFTQEPDHVPVLRLAGLGLAGLLVFCAGICWAATVQRGATGTVRSDTAARPEHAGEREIGMVYQSPFSGDRGITGEIAAGKRAAGRARLEATGWVDRSRGLVRIPIERAMDLVARRGTL